jgi:FADH2 O2-dependent halogenase
MEQRRNFEWFKIMRPDCDLAIIGTGFGGSLLAMIARRIGLAVVLLERGRHPRFVIGESSSPLANLIIEELAARYHLPRLKPLTSYGEWQRTYPEVVCGLKRGFTFFKHEAGHPYRTAPDRSNQLLVAASPCDDVADTHWLRSDVDHFLVNEAIALGAEYLDEVELRGVEWPASGIALLRGARRGQMMALRTRMIIDSSGPRGFLSRQLNIAEEPFDRYPATQALYSHFTGVKRCDDLAAYKPGGAPPYPMDDAALHHVFDGGWMWVLRFNNGVTSAGVAVTDALAGELRLADGEPAWDRVLSRFPSIAEQFSEAQPIREFTWMPRLSYRAARAAGAGWALLPSAAAFVDPLLSTGIPLTLLGIERLAPMLEESGCGHELANWMREYDEVTLAEADHTARFIAGCYAGFPQFETFTTYSMFYFVAASFSEMARRLNRRHLTRRFLASDHPTFGVAAAALGQVLQNGGVQTRRFEQEIRRQTDCLNIAGLCDLSKANWYDVDLEDVVKGAARLGMTPTAIRAALGRAEWAKACGM